MVIQQESLADILIKLCKEFNKNNVEYIVIGGFAMIFHGLPRLTEDIDIAINISNSNLDKIKKTLKTIFQDNSFDEITKKDFEEYSVIRYGTPENFYIDFIYNIGEIADFDLLFKNRKNIIIDNVNIPILNEKMLIRLKENTVRIKDSYDANFLKEKLKGE